jgi:hypothetical protein
MGGKTSKSDKKNAKTELTDEEIELLLKNTHFNRDQIIEWHQGFIKGLRISLLIKDAS